MDDAQKTAIGHRGDLSTTLGMLAHISWVLGALGLLAAIVAASNVTKVDPTDPWADNGLAPFWIGVGIASVFQGAAMAALLAALAEILRLLKASAGLPYTGKISKPEPVNVAVCSKCKAEVLESDTRCWNCKAVFANTGSADSEKPSRSCPSKARSQQVGSPDSFTYASLTAGHSRRLLWESAPSLPVCAWRTPSYGRRWGSAMRSGRNGS